MIYKCKQCSWTIEGQTQVMKDILIHEKTHDKEG